LIGAGNEGRVLRDALAQSRVSDLTLLDDCDPLKVEALRRLHYVQAVFDERPRFRTQETLSPIIERISEQIKDENPPSWTTLKRWSRIYERSGEDVRALVPAIKARGNRRAKYSISGYNMTAQGDRGPSRVRLTVIALAPVVC
jgi:hypothetical protein